MKATILLLALIAAALASGAAPAGLDERYPQPSAAALAKAFTGKPVPASWLGAWQFRLSPGTAVVWRIYGSKTPACRAITAGRVSCWTMRPPEGSISAGAIGIAGANLVLRMTYTSNPNGVSCFADDAYGYRYSTRRLRLLKRSASHCFWESTASFPIVLRRVT